MSRKGKRKKNRARNEMTKSLLLVLTLATAPVLQSSCERGTGPCNSTIRYPPRNTDRVSIRQGVWGDVWFWEGDFMPVCISGTVTAVGREMRIHELTSWQEVTPVGGGPFYQDVSTPLIATVWSDAEGFFQAALPTGQYSLFAVEDSLLYANGSDGVGNIWPVEVDSGMVTGVVFNIDYRATY